MAPAKICRNLVVVRVPTHAAQREEKKARQFQILPFLACLCAFLWWVWGGTALRLHLGTLFSFSLCLLSPASAPDGRVQRGRPAAVVAERILHVGARPLFPEAAVQYQGCGLESLGERRPCDNGLAQPRRDDTGPGEVSATIRDDRV